MTTVDRGGSPFLLSAESELPITAGTVRVFDQLALSNPYQTALVVDSIRFVTQWNTTDPTDFFQLYPGGIVRVKFNMNGMELSRDYVPLGLYSPVVQYAITNASPGPSVAWIENNTGQKVWSTPTDAAASNYSHFQWKLPRPLLIPPGGALVPQGLVSVAWADQNGDGITLKIGYGCRRMPSDFKMPDKMDVPWVTTFLPGLVTSSIQAVQSSELNLVNLWSDKDLHVQRFISRVYGDNPQSIVATQEQFAAASVGQIQLTHSDEREINKILQPDYGAVFDISRRVWDASFVLKPHERINVLWNQFTPGDGVEPMISMVGWREESL